MKTSLDLSRFTSQVRVWTPDNPNHVVTGKNLITYGGADIIARLLAGQGNYRLVRMWFEFDNGGSPATPAPSREDTAVSVIAEATGTRDILRGSLVAQPLLQASGPDYGSNQGVYHAITPAGSSIQGEVNSLAFGAGSSIIGLCLAASPGGSDIEDDWIYSRFALGAGDELAVGSSGQVAATWMTEAT